MFRPIELGIFLNLNAIYAVKCEGWNVTLTGAGLKISVLSTRIWAISSVEDSVGVWFVGTVILTLAPSLLLKAEAGLNSAKDTRAVDDTLIFPLKEAESLSREGTTEALIASAYEVEGNMRTSWFLVQNTENLGSA